LKSTWRIGDTHTYTLTATPDTSANAHRESLPDVFGTPHLVMAVEEAAAALMEPWLEPGELSAGAHVDLRHTAPTPIGMEVRTVARLVESDGRKFVFAVECFDAVEPIGHARHTRFVIDRRGFMAQVAEKARR
jgi:fluoroacetyl-CoA thioesterase